jgi:hypothetical protein
VLGDKALEVSCARTRQQPIPSHVGEEGTRPQVASSQHPHPLRDIAIEVLDSEPA